MRYLFLLLFLLLSFAKSFAQQDSAARVTDTALLFEDSALLIARDAALVALTDSTKTLKKDSVVKAKPTRKLTWVQDTAFNKYFKNPYPKAKQQAVYMISKTRQAANKDVLFYILAGLFLFLAIIRAGFPKYFQNIFRLFFQSAYRQKQSKESLLQDNLPSFLLNIVFILSAGLFIALLSYTSARLQQFSFWLLWLYICAVLAIIYVGKYLFISFCGWAFNVQQPAFNYNFITFLVNKMAGISLMPLLLLLAFADEQLYHIAYTIAITIVIILLLYRYIVALSAIVKNLKVHAVHFFIYLCAVEILPLLVIYKLLFIAAGK